MFRTKCIKGDKCWEQAGTYTILTFLNHFISHFKQQGWWNINTLQSSHTVQLFHVAFTCFFIMSLSHTIQESYTFLPVNFVLVMLNSFRWIGNQVVCLKEM